MDQRDVQNKAEQEVEKLRNRIAVLGKMRGQDDATREWLARPRTLPSLRGKMRYLERLNREETA